MSLQYPVPTGGTAGNVVIVDTDGDTLTDTDIVNQLDDGDIGRAKLTEDALQVYAIPIGNVRAADGAGLGISETAGDMNLSLGTNIINLIGEASQGETEASVAYAMFTLPPEYVSAGDVKVRFHCKLDGNGTNNGSTIDVNAYELASGAVGSDLCATAAQTFAATKTYYDKDFTITATGLVAGDTLLFKFTSSVIESGGSATLTFTSDWPKVLLDVKG